MNNRLRSLTDVAAADRFDDRDVHTGPVCDPALRTPRMARHLHDREDRA